MQMAQQHFEFIVLHRGTQSLRAGASIWARGQHHAEQILRQREGICAKAFWVRQISPEDF